MPATAVEAVRTQTNPLCHANNCRDGGCALAMAGAPEPYVLISLEHSAAPVPAGQQHCDYLFVGGDDENGGPWVVPVELTTGRKRASEFLAQIRGGTLVADSLLPTRRPGRFNPVAAYRRALHRDDIADLRKPANHVNFRGQRRQIQLVECGTRLADALAE